LQSTKVKAVKQSLMLLARKRPLLKPVYDFNCALSSYMYFEGKIERAIFNAGLLVTLRLGLLLKKQHHILQVKIVCKHNIEQKRVYAQRGAGEGCGNYLRKDLLKQWRCVESCKKLK
jgi:hypothetical protein